MAKAPLNPQNMAAKWKANYSRSGPAYVAGVQAVTVAPGIAAAAAAQKYADRTQAAVTSGKYQRRVSGVSNSSWQQSCITTGQQRMASGATKGEPKFSAFAQQAVPAYNDIRATAQSMPNDGSTEQQAAIVAMAINKMKALGDSLK